MSILAKHVEFVKDQAEFHRKMVDKYAKSIFRANLHIKTAEKFSALLEDILAADKTLDLPLPVARPKTNDGHLQLSLSLSDIDGLPQELIAELGLSDADKTEFAIIGAIEDAGGIISLNKLLIALYKMTGEIHRRQSLYPRLARMVQKNAIYYVPGKKGVYSTEQLSNEDVVRLFGLGRDDEDAET